MNQARGGFKRLPDGEKKSLMLKLRQTRRFGPHKATSFRFVMA